MKTIGKARASRYPLDWPFNIISNPYERPFRQEGLSFLGNYIHFGSCKEAGINLGNTELALYFYRLP